MPLRLDQLRELCRALAGHLKPLRGELFRDLGLRQNALQGAGQFANGSGRGPGRCQNALSGNHLKFRKT